MSREKRREMESYLGFYLLSFLALTKTAHTVEQTPPFVRAHSGQSATITCIGGSEDFDGLYLRRKFIQQSQVLYVHKSSTITVEKNYTDRMKTEGDTKKLTLIISNLMESDTDGYFCEFGRLDMETGKLLNIRATGTLIVVQDEVKEVTCPPVDPNPPSSSLQLTPTLMIVTSLAAVCVLILCIVALIIWQLPNIKKCFAKQRSQQAVQDTVYEEMAKSREQSSLCLPTQPLLIPSCKQTDPLDQSSPDVKEQLTSNMCKYTIVSEKG